MILKSAVSTLSAFIRTITNKSLPGTQEGQLVVDLNDVNGNPLPLYDTEAINAEQYGLPLVGISDRAARLIRGDTYGGLASCAFQPLFNMHTDFSSAYSHKQAKYVANLGTAPSGSPGTTPYLQPSYSSSPNYGIWFSNKYFSLVSKAPIMARFNISINVLSHSSIVCEFGFATSAELSTSLAYASNTNGAFWRLDVNGVMPVLAVNGSIVATGTNIVASLSVSTYYIYDIIKDDNVFIFICTNTMTGAVISKQILTSAVTKITNGDHAYTYIRQLLPAYTNGLILYVSNWSVVQLDQQMNYSTGEQAATLGFSSDSSPTSSTNTTYYFNNTASTNVTLSNTNSPIDGYLDGVTRFMIPNGSSTEYLLFSFGLTGNTFYQLVTRSISITTKLIVGPTATTMARVNFYLKYNGAGESLASAGYLSRFIGGQSFPIGAVAGTAATEGKITLDLTSCPAITNYGKFYAITAVVVIGTQTAAFPAIEVNVSHVGNFS